MYFSLWIMIQIAIYVAPIHLAVTTGALSD